MVVQAAVMEISWWEIGDLNGWVAGRHCTHNDRTIRYSDVN
jgi:hypothetical protein